MSTPLTDAINALTTYANSVTGESSTTLSDAVDDLVAGYGGGGGSGMPLLKTETIPADTRYVSIELAPYIDKSFVILVIDFELTEADWLYYAINASEPQTANNYGLQNGITHRTIAFLHGNLGDCGQTTLIPSSSYVFGKYNGTINNLMINAYSASKLIKAGSTYSIYGM